MNRRAKKLIPLFVRAEKATGIPAAYYYALAGRESNWKPAAREPTGAVGLFQITGGVLKDYNKAHGTELTKTDMLSAKRNTDVASWYLKNVVHKLVPADFSSPRETAVFTFAWNSGPYGGVRLIDEVGGLGKATADAMHKRAKQIVAAGKPVRGLDADKYRWFARRATRWVKSVARDTQRAMGDPDFSEARAPQAVGVGGLLRRLLRFFFSRRS